MTPQLREEYLHTMEVLYYHKPKDRYKVRLEYYGKPCTEHWISAKQMESLRRAFDQTLKGYSCIQAVVYGVFDGDWFCYAIVKPGRRMRVVPAPLEAPEHVEIDEALRDEP